MMHEDPLTVLYRQARRLSERYLELLNRRDRGAAVELELADQELEAAERQVAEYLGVPYVGPWRPLEPRTRRGTRKPAPPQLELGT